MGRSVDELKGALLRAELVDDVELSSVDGRSGTVEDFADTLVDRGLVTRFQAERLLAGEGHTLTLGRYVLLDTIGAGGMGQVFLARHRRMNREVALKILPSKFTRDQQAVARFAREVEAAARLTHPNIVRAHDASEANGVHYLVMEYVAGRDLSSLVKSNGPQPVDQALDYVIQAANGLRFAHDNGVLHRDIKPANLLLSDDGVLKILDMGLARLESGRDASLTRTGVVMGTIDYMSPEQALDSKTADARADIYSLGCTLHFLLTGQPVFAGDTSMKKLLAHRETSVPPLHERCPEASQALNAVFQRMLAKEPNRRLQNMTEVIDLLQQCREGAIAESDLAWQTTRSSLSTATSLSFGKKVGQARTEVQLTKPASRNHSLVIAGLLCIAALSVCLSLAFLPDATTKPDDLQPVPAAGSTGELSPKSTTSELARTRQSVPPTPEELFELPPAATPTASPAVPTITDMTGHRLSGLIATPAEIPGISRWQMIRPQIAGHGSCFIDWSPSGEFIAMCFPDGIVRMYDLRDRDVSSAICCYGERLPSLDWAPDGQSLLITFAGRIEKWVVSGERQFKRVAIFDSESERIHKAVWSKDGRRIVAPLYQQKQVILFDSNLKGVRTIDLPGMLSTTSDIDVSGDSTRFAIIDGAGGMTIASFDGRELGQAKPGLFAQLDWHPKTDEIVTVTPKEIAYWKPDGSKIDSQPVVRESPWQRIQTVRWSPDGEQLLVVANNDRSFHIYSRAGDLLLSRKTESAPGPSSWNPDGKAIATSGKRLSIHNLNSEESETCVEQQTQLLTSQSWDAATGRLAVTSWDGQINVCDVAKNSVDRFETSYQLYEAEWSPDGQRFVASSMNIKLALFDATYKKLSDIDVTARSHFVSWSSDSSTLAVGVGKRLTLHDTEGKLLSSHELLEAVHNSGSIAWHPTEPILAIGSGKEVQLRNKSGKLISRWSAVHSSLTWSGDGSNIITTSRGQEVAVWSRSGELLFSDNQLMYPHEIDANSDNGTVATMGYTAKISTPSAYTCNIWTAQGNYLGGLPVVHNSRGRSLAWSPGGDMLSVKGMNGGVQLWSGSPLKHLKSIVLNGESEAFILNEDGTQLLSVNAENFADSFLWVVESEDGIQKTMNKSEFDQLLADAGHLIAPDRSLPIGSSVIAGLLPETPQSETGELWQITSSRWTQELNSIAWSSIGEIACATGAGQVRLLDGETLEASTVLHLGSARVRSLAWSPDGARLIAGSENGRVWMYDQEDGLRKLRVKETGPVIAVEWHSDGTHFATCSSTRARIWSSDGRPLHHLQGHTRNVGHIAWHPQKLLLATCASYASEVFLWNDSGERVRSVVQANVVAMDWKPGTDQLYLWGRIIDGKTCAIIYDAATDMLSPSSLPTTPEMIAARLSPDALYVAVGRHTNSLRLLGMDGTDRFTISGNGPGNWIGAIAWSSDSQRIAYASSWDVIRVCDVEGNLLAESGRADHSAMASWSHDSKYIATAGNDQFIRRWAADGSHVDAFASHTARVRSVDYSPTDNRLASLSDDGIIRIWNAAGEEVAHFDGMRTSSGAITEATHDLAWHPSGQIIAAAGAASSLKIINPDTGEVLTWTGLWPIQSLAWNPDGNRLAIGCQPNLLLSWEPRQPAPRFYAIKKLPTAMAWYADNELIFAGKSGEGIWKVRMDAPHPQTFGTRSGLVTDVAVSPDRRYFVIADRDILLCQSNGRTISTLRTALSYPHSVSWSPDGTQVAATHNDGTVSNWSVGTSTNNWTGIPSTDGTAVTLSPTGLLLFGDPSTCMPEFTAISLSEDQHVRSSHLSSHLEGQ